MASFRQYGALVAGLALLFVPFTPTQGQARDDWLSNLNISGRTYLRWSEELGPQRDHYNEFAVDRLYLTFKFRLWDRARLQYTLEGGDLRDVDVNFTNGRLVRTSSALEDVTKHLFFEYADLLGKGSWLRVGLSDLPYISYDEGIWGYRLQGTVFADRSGYLTSTDLGVSVGGPVPSGYGSWHVSLVNGEGWRRSESGKHKDLHARLTVNPLAGVGKNAAKAFVTAYRVEGRYDDVIEGPTTKDRTVLMAGYKSVDRFTVAGEYVRTTDPAQVVAARYPSVLPRAGLLSNGRGASLYATLTPKALGARGAGEKLEFIARLDRLDPDSKVADNSLRRAIGGVSYKVHQKMTVLLNLEDVKVDRAAGMINSTRLLLQTEVRF